MSASGLIDAVESLRSGGTPPGLVIIDDGWQQTDLDLDMRIRKDAASVLSALQGDSPDSEAAMLARESYIEGETDAIAAVLREIPEGTATGKLLQEVKGAEDMYGEVDHAALARQHDAATEAVEARNSRSLQAIQSAISESRGSHRRGNLVVRVTGTLAQYFVGLLVGAFQALVLIFYQWIVDPAEDGTWPVRFFAYLTSGPFRVPMLEFYADQTNFTRRLVSVRANSKFHSPEASPDAIHSAREDNLGSVVAHLRSELNVRFVYCWHGLSAYWCGVSPEAASMQRYLPRLVFAKPTASLREIEPSMNWNPSVIGGIGAVYDPGALFHDMHSYLASCGISGVKVDCQAGVGMVGSVTGGGPAIAARYHSALEDSVARHFPKNDVINCMCHSTENIYRWRDTAVARASDDFYPSDAASHSPHIAACAFNGLFLSALALPDFDMFHSRHRAADLHAAARAVSGGPVYVSDAPGKHSFDVLKQLVLPDGHILRCKLPGRPTRDCLFVDVLRDGKSLLKIWNMNSVNGVVGVFHLQGSCWDRSRRRFAFHDLYPPQLSVAVKPTDVEMFRARWDIRDPSKPSLTTKTNVLGSSNGSDDNLAMPPLVEETGVVSNGDSHPAAEVDRRSTHRRDIDSAWNSPSNDNEEASVTTSFYGSTSDRGSSSFATSNDRSGYESDVSSAFERPPRSYRNRTTFRGSGNDGYEASQSVSSIPQFAAYVNSTGSLLKVGLHEDVNVAVKSLEAAIVTFAPIVVAHDIEFAAVGLINMLNAGGAIVALECQVDDDLSTADGAYGYDDESSADLGSTGMQYRRVTFAVKVKGRGSLLALSDRQPVKCLVEGEETMFAWMEDEQRLEIDVPQRGKHVEQIVHVEFGIE